MRARVTEGAEGSVSQRAKSAQQARTRARERRLLALDDGRAAREQRIEVAAAEVYLRTEERAAARAAVAAAEDAMGAALCRVLSERITVDQAATLCELKVAEVRRLVRRTVDVDAAGTAKHGDS